ncbi:hypothetical protein MCOR02_004658 [Pyricularia oryzae]|nr:hypothetical protein MCOR02_004658 [Pyricularia oryzae]
MAESGAEAGAPNLNLTPDEKRYYGQLFRQADTDGVGVVTGDVAVKFFDKTRLESRILGEIWQIADQENRGFLTPAGFGIVLRLIGHAQAGREPTPEVALQPGPLPRFDGINIPGLAPQTSGSGPGPAAMPLQAQGTGVRIPPLTPEKAAQYAGLFEQQNLAPGTCSQVTRPARSLKGPACLPRSSDAYGSWPIQNSGAHWCRPSSLLPCISWPLLSKANYVDCPMLCPLVSMRLQHAARPGFRVKEALLRGCLPFPRFPGS